MTGPTAVEGSAVGALASWANGLDGWVRVIASRVLARRTALDDDTIEVGYQEMLAEKGLSSEAPKSAPAIEITEAPPDDAPPLRLIRIGETSHVNRLVDGQEISFNNRITVVYGRSQRRSSPSRRVHQLARDTDGDDRVLAR